MDEEECVSKVFESWGMTFPVALSYDPVGEYAQFPWIRPSTMLRALASTGDFRFLMGGFQTMQSAKAALEEFWARYESVYPQHGIFRKVRESNGQVRLSQCLPLSIHGDEGTTYKRNGVLVIQFAGILGFGSRKTEESMKDWEDDVKACGIPLNLIKNAFQTRFLSVLCPKDRDVVCWNPS